MEAMLNIGATILAAEQTTIPTPTMDTQMPAIPPIPPEDTLEYQTAFTELFHDLKRTTYEWAADAASTRIRREQNNIRREVFRDARNDRAPQTYPTESTNANTELIFSSNRCTTDDRHQTSSSCCPP